MVAVVLDAIIDATKNGDRPVRFDELMYYLRDKYRVEVSTRELLNALLKLEVSGWIRVYSSKRFEDYLIELVRLRS